MQPDFVKQFEAYVRQGVKELDIDLSEKSWASLLKYFSLLQEFGKPLGLTALESPLDFAVKHLLDSLSVLPFLPPGSLLDLGTGAGLPGMVIKLLEPEREVWLVDARKKPISFLTYVVGVMGIKKVKVIQTRVGRSDPLPRRYFEGVVSRAVSDLSLLWSLAHPLLKEGQPLLALKGPKVIKEIQILRQKDPLLEIKAHPLRLPLLGEERIIVEVRTPIKGSPN